MGVRVEVMPAGCAGRNPRSRNPRKETRLEGLPRVGDRRERMCAAPIRAAVDGGALRTASAMTTFGVRRTLRVLRAVLLFACLAPPLAAIDLGEVNRLAGRA